jgi:hypothetical protein
MSAAISNVKTKRGAIRRYEQIMRACRRDLAGGLSFGMDWPTLRGTFPERYAELQILKANYGSLPA